MGDRLSRVEGVMEDRGWREGVMGDRGWREGVMGEGERGWR